MFCAIPETAVSRDIASRFHRFLHFFVVVSRFITQSVTCSSTPISKFQSVSCTTPAPTGNPECHLQHTCIYRKPRVSPAAHLYLQETKSVSCSTPVSRGNLESHLQHTCIYRKPRVSPAAHLHQQETQSVSCSTPVSRGNPECHLQHTCINRKPLLCCLVQRSNILSKGEHVQLCDCIFLLLLLNVK